jgi:hypothetical protein
MDTALLIAVAVVVLVLLSLLAWMVYKIALQKKAQSTQDTYFCYADDLLNTTSVQPTPTTLEVLTERGIQVAANDEASTYLFETLNDIDNLMVTAKFGPNARLVYGIRGTDFMANKATLADSIRRTLPKSRSDALLPVTYIYGNREDEERLARATSQHPGLLCILKKNVQRQEGNLITREPGVVLGAGQQGYVVCQEVLQDPLTVGERKINLRVYVLVTVTANGVSFYAYRNGFIYYTPKEWKPNSDDPEHNITTGYIDRRVYQENPMTLGDLEQHMGAESYDKLWKSILVMIKDVATAYSDTLLRVNAPIAGDVKFLVYGFDVAPDTKLDVKLMEINKGPDLEYKDERDKEVKLAMVRDMWKVASEHPLEAGNTGFAQVHLLST